MRDARNWLAGLLCLASVPAFAQVAIESPWARATPPGVKIAGGFMLIVNRGAQPDRLIGVSSPAAARVETHVHEREGDLMRMREVAGLDVPATGRLELKPGGAHLMFMDIKQPFREGDTISATLRFERAGELRVKFRVGGMAAMSGDGRTGGGPEHRNMGGMPGQGR